MYKKRTLTVKLQKNSSLLILGPAQINLISGRASIFSYPIKVGDPIVVERCRQISVYGEEKSIIQISGELAEIMEIEGSTIPTSWNILIQKLKEVSADRIVVIGGSDVGKSTLCTFLINKLLNYYPKVTVIDSDIGQSDIGPPTAIGKGSTCNPIKDFNDIKLEHVFFIGAKSPFSLENKFLYGLKKIFSVVEKSDNPIVINTDGWLNGSNAIQFKLDFLRCVSPTLIVSIGDEAEKLVKFFNYPIIRLEPASHAFPRNMNQRKQLREFKFHRFLRNGRVNIFNVDEIVLGGNILGLRDADLPSLLVGLLDENEWLINIGVIVAARLDKKKIYVYSRADRPPHIIDGGFIKIDKTGKERV